jgi:hypothetical protein
MAGLPLRTVVDSELTALVQLLLLYGTSLDYS